jgi:hypothetical protein
MSGVILNLNVLGELFVGYALPGELQALSTAKALMMTIAEQAMNFAQDQKQTHYAHLPPRSIFGIQLWGPLWSTYWSVWGSFSSRCTTLAISAQKRTP